MNPSPPIPEGPARRAALTAEISARTGLTEARLEHVVRRFYAAARQDPLLGPVFARVEDWDAHIAQVTAFWSSVALMTGRYHGQPMAAHLNLDVNAAHFTRWLDLFEQVARAECGPEGVEWLMERARRIARSLEMGIAVHRGELPGSRTA